MATFTHLKTLYNDRLFALRRYLFEMKMRRDGNTTKKHDRTIPCSRWAPYMVCVAFLFGGCAHNPAPYKDLPLDALYEKALKQLKEQEYTKAAASFDRVEQQYPYSEWAPKARVMSAYASYRSGNLVRAIDTVDEFYALHPTHDLVAYALYLKGRCAFDRVKGADHEAERFREALRALRVVFEKYPNTPYAKPARDAYDEVWDMEAAQHMRVGRYYLKQHFLQGAHERFALVCERYSTTRQYPEALYRIAEIYATIGARQELAVLVKDMTERLKEESPNTDGDRWLRKAVTLNKNYGVPSIS